jgi:uncharacterized protein YutE (UPF0331/DUF86 family)
MVGTPDITADFETKTELDIRNRLIAKFAIPRAKSFWNSGFQKMPPSALFPSGDSVEDLCKEITTRLREEESRSDIGQFLLEWAQLEEKLLPRARRLTERNLSVGEAISALARDKTLPQDVATALNDLRRVRNMAAHTPGKVDNREINRAMRRLRELLSRIPADRI